MWQKSRETGFGGWHCDRLAVVLVACQLMVQRYEIWTPFVKCFDVRGRVSGRLWRNVRMFGCNPQNLFRYSVIQMFFVVCCLGGSRIHSYIYKKIFFIYIAMKLLSPHYEGLENYLNNWITEYVCSLDRTDVGNVVVCKMHKINLLWWLVVGLDVRNVCRAKCPDDVVLPVSGRFYFAVSFYFRTFAAPKQESKT